MTDVIKVKETVRKNVRHVEVVSRGRQGPPGGIIVPYIHQQAVASATWTINHNLGFQPDVYLADQGGNEIDAQVLHVSVNQALVYFNLPTAGTARCH